MGSKNLRLAAIAIAVLAGSILVASPGAGARPKPGWELDIVTCPDGSQAPADECEESSQQVPQSPQRPSRPDRSQDEIHDLNLDAGDSGVSGPGGDRLDLNLDSRDPDGNIQLGTPAPSRPEVTTTGGSFAGSGSPFDFVSADEALASFEVPPFLLPIYVSAGRAYNVPWNVLAAINQIETDFGRLGACVESYAGAQGWMQFIPSTWATYGVDASGDGAADPCNPVDAIYAAARYLRASGAPDDMRGAIFSYNHADWYVDRVLHTASVYGSLPGGLVTETGSLAFGRFPVRGPVSYGDDFRAAQLAGAAPKGLLIHPRGRASAIATQNATVTRVLLSRRLASAFRRDPGRAGPGEQAASLSPYSPLGSLQVLLRLAPKGGATHLAAKLALDGIDSTVSGSVEPGADGLPDGYAIAKGAGVGVEVSDPAGNRYRYEGLEKLRPELRPGAELEGGDVLGPLDRKRALLFSVRAAGGSAVDPRPLVDGYRLQEAADYFHAVEPLGGNPFLPDEEALSAGLLSGDQAELAREVLSDPGISIYSCGRQDIEAGKIDKRVLGALLFLRRNGLTLTVTSLNCGHSYYTAGGSVSAHSYGAAVDIAAFNGEPVLGHQGPGSLTEHAIRLLMSLHGAARPSQLISLMSFGGPSFALSDHDDHLHVGYDFSTSLGLGRSGEAVGPVEFGGGSAGGQGLEKPGKGPEARRQEQRLSEKFNQIQNPDVPSKASPGAPRVRGEGERQHESGAVSHAGDEGVPLEAAPSASGAEMVAIDTPGDGPEAYGLGLVDGAPRGWAERQAVVLALRKGSWAVIGPPRDAEGKAVNPKLRELATIPGGSGYAVGKGGAVIELRGSRPPLLIDSGVKSDLRDVDVASEGGRAVGYAVGAGGTVLRIDGAHVVREHAGSSQSSIAAVTLGRGDPLAAGSDVAGRPLLFQRRGSGRWDAVPVEIGLAHGTSVELEAVDARGGEVWVSGSLADSAGTPLRVPFVAERSGGGWTTFCSANPALSVVEELGEPTAGPCDQGLPSNTPGVSASAIAVSGSGAIVAAGGVLTVLGPDRAEHKPTAVAPGPVADLAAVTRNEGGFALGLQGRLVRFGSGAAAKGGAVHTTELPLGNARPVLVAAAGPGELLATGAGRVAIGGEAGWREAAPTGLAARDADLLGGSMIWAIDELGKPIQLTEDGWLGPGEDESDREERDALADSLGGYPLATPDAEDAGTGLRALAFGPEGDGYAAGHQLIGLFDPDGGWRFARSELDFFDAAAGPDGAVVVGESGAVMESDGGDLEPSREAAGLSHGADLTAAAALDDGTLLAGGGGVVLARDPGSGAWSSLDLPPLGLEVRRLAGVREGGELSVLALLDAGGELVLVRGDRSGWRPLALPPGVTLSDMAPIPGSGSVLLGGDRYGRAVTLKLKAGGK